jgi:predicted AAA+ superfamily ATPase
MEGKVEMLHLAPLDFEEFLVAAGEQGLRDEIRSCFTTNRAMIKPLHEKCLRLYRLYLCAGGMPEAVLDLIEHDLDILLFRDSILRDIRSSYLKDMSKYIHSPLESARIEDAYDSLPTQLSNKSGKFQFARIRSGARGRDYGSALDWLLSSGMIYRCERVSKPLMPLKGYRDEGFFKLFLNDTGLLCDALEIPRNLVALDSAFPYKGVLAESYVACQLAAAGRSLYYWQSGNTAEVDFLLQYDEGIIPLETKAGRWTVSPSMRVFAERFRPPYCVKVSTRNFGLENGVRSVPLYAVFCL